MLPCKCSKQINSAAQPKRLFGFILPVFDNFLMQLYTAVPCIVINYSTHDIIIVLHKFKEWRKPFVPTCALRCSFDHHGLVMFARKFENAIRAIAVIRSNPIYKLIAWIPIHKRMPAIGLVTQSSGYPHESYVRTSLSLHPFMKLFPC